MKSPPLVWGREVRCERRTRARDGLDSSWLRTVSATAGVSWERGRRRSGKKWLTVEKNSSHPKLMMPINLNFLQITNHKAHRAFIKNFHWSAKMCPSKVYILHEV